MMTIDRLTIIIENGHPKIFDRENGSTIILFGNNVKPETEKGLCELLLPIIDEYIKDGKIKLEYYTDVEYLSLNNDELRDDYV